MGKVIWKAENTKRDKKGDITLFNGEPFVFYKPRHSSSLTMIIFRGEYINFLSFRKRSSFTVSFLLCLAFARHSLTLT